jgi:BirA family biotin operon repressor/biotin-[acetyl-CoA-carboxylase] ligase
MRALKGTAAFSHVVSTLNDGEFHDGTGMSSGLRLSRTAIWKVVKKLIAYGLTIESVKGKGYCLAEPLVLLNQKVIEAALQHDIEVELFESLPSTQAYFKGIAHYQNHPQLCITETQSDGVGRFGRSWHTPFGQNITMSLTYHFDQDISELGGLSLLAALSVAKALEGVCELTTPLHLKWPNDIIHDNKKVAGILIDAQVQFNGGCTVVIGMGVNVNLSGTQPIDQPWTSLRDIAGKSFDRNVLVSSILNTLLDDIEAFNDTGFAPFAKRWQAKSALIGHDITLHIGKHHIEGKVIDVNANGQIVLNTADGVRTFSSGEASLRSS